jgi:hypothetical protein
VAPFILGTIADTLGDILGFALLLLIELALIGAGLMAFSQGVLTRRRELEGSEFKYSYRLAAFVATVLLAIPFVQTILFLNFLSIGTLARLGRAIESIMHRLWMAFSLSDQSADTMVDVTRIVVVLVATFLVIDRLINYAVEKELPGSGPTNTTT